MSNVAARAAAELRRRREEGGVRYFNPANEQQAEALSDEDNVLLLGGNRSGKTVCGAVETTCRLLGEHPYKDVPKGPVKTWACSQVLPGSGDKPHVQLEELKRWIPKDALRGGEWAKSYSPGARTLHLANGSVCEFKGYDQGLLSFESAKLHWIWFDEEPPVKEIFTSCQMRLLDYRGKWWMTVTPVLSLQGRGWIEDGLYEPWMAVRGANLNYNVIQISTFSNPHLSQEMVNEALGSMSAEEKAVRAHGSFARIGGSVLSEWDPTIHKVAPFLPPRSWRHYLIIDPGYRNATAGLWAAVDPEGAIFLYGEHYVREQLPPFHTFVLDRQWHAFGEPEVDTLMDPATFKRVGTVLGRSEYAVVDEYNKAAAALKADWFAPRPAQNDSKGVWRIKRYLTPNERRDGQKVPLLYVCSHLHWWNWERERWTWPAEKRGLSANEKPVTEKPKEKDNHLMDCTKYLVNELPDPLEIWTPPTPRSWDQTIGKHLQRIVDRNSGKSRRR